MSVLPDLLTVLGNLAAAAAVTSIAFPVYRVFKTWTAERSLALQLGRRKDRLNELVSAYSLLRSADDENSKVADEIYKYLLEAMKDLSPADQDRLMAGLENRTAGGRIRYMEKLIHEGESQASQLDNSGS